MKIFRVIFALAILSVGVSCGDDNQSIDVGGDPNPVNNKLVSRLGVTHTGGHYIPADMADNGSPYLYMGASRAYQEGFRVIKFFVSKTGVSKSFYFNSDWSDLPSDPSFVDVVSHRYFEQAFVFPFSTIIFNITEQGDLDLTPEQYNVELAEHKREFKEVSLYLMERFKDRNMNIILKNWEGDWVLRPGYAKKEEWEDTNLYSPEYVANRVTNFVSWVKARQEAVNEARDEMSSAKCSIYYVVEANKVMESMEGTIGVANTILSQVEVDMVSWSSYDGLKSQSEFREGIQYLKRMHRPTGAFPSDVAVIIGEVGIAENREANKIIDIPAKWRWILDTCWEEDLPYVIHWELFCNEPLDGDTKNDYSITFTEELMGGFWIIKPDGTKSEGAQYVVDQLKKSI